MDIKKVFQENYTKLLNYQTIFAGQFNNLALFQQKLEELQYIYYQKSQDNYTDNLINNLQMRIKNFLALLILATNALDKNISILKEVNSIINSLPAEIISQYITSEEKILASCTLSCDKVNAGIIAVVSIINKVRKRINNDQDLSR